MSTLIFTEDAQAAFEEAVTVSLMRHSLFVDVEHLFLGMLRQADTEPLKGILAGVDAQPGKLAARVSAELGVIRESPLPKSEGMTRQLQSLLQDAVVQARNLGHGFVNNGHLLLALLNLKGGVIQPLLADLRLDSVSVQEYVRTHSRKPARPQPVSMVEAKPRRKAKTPPAANLSRGLQDSIAVWGGMLGILGMLYFLNEVAFYFWFVVVGWILSLSLHEFGHALVAYWGGDYTVRAKGYLTLNPLRYTQPLLSIGLPLLFLAMGGIGLPGGAVYIESHRLRARWWNSAVSAAGPAATAICGVIFALPFILGLVDTPSFFDPTRLEAALAFLVFLQCTALLFNLLPLPPLDGFGILAPYLDPKFVEQARAFGFFGIIILFFVLFRIPIISQTFYDSVFQMTDFLRVPVLWVFDGLDNFRFWRN